MRSRHLELSGDLSLRGKRLVHYARAREDIPTSERETTTRNVLNFYNEP
jgi:hypothetical protein